MIYLGVNPLMAFFLLSLFCMILDWWDRRKTHKRLGNIEQAILVLERRQRRMSNALSDHKQSVSEQALFYLLGNHGIIARELRSPDREEETTKAA